MGCTSSTSPASSAAVPGGIAIYGMPISANVIPVVLLAMDKKVGGLGFKDMMKGELKTTEMLAVNPWGQMPSMRDEDFCLAESNAILRYIANAHAPDTYGGTDIEKKAMIDWALDWASTNFSKQYFGIWYPTAGFAPAPEDQKAVNKAALENMAKFETLFLAKTKFVAGNTPSIADYKIAVLFWYLDFEAIRDQRDGFQTPPRIKEYVKDFMARCESSKEFLKDATDFMGKLKK
eukprot:CAMPEP_0171197680 /NCGR_PEP_ID=MMETSP0790-20130122/22535_1 /TAXON_ID=2925 /ORGANISM="Alexandrium catenella, Strain OF101" /LENGTH=233 /DNA_ID=CAMNT_0011662927 /DNA_START=68 /DNA_END=769 /DNA_ORIENTATION=-